VGRRRRRNTPTKKKNKDVQGRTNEPPREGTGSTITGHRLSLCFLETRSGAKKLKGKEDELGERNKKCLNRKICEKVVKDAKPEG